MDAPPSVSVNLAPEDLLDPTLPDRIVWELDRRKIDPSFLTIEILEMVVAKSRDDVISKNICRLAEMGCQIDLDDFGTGHASISTLQQFPVHRVKIDRSFITGLQDAEEKQNMVAAILTMAGQLGLETLAEGVETPEEEACLIRLGCGHLQGFGIARPMPLNDTLKWLTQRLALAEQNSKAPKASKSKTG
ncbi:MAG: EAL domain-containing protein [Pseudomonadota bacterium]